MAEIQAIFGPYKTKEENTHMTWFFSGIRANGDFTGWSLRFHFDTRCFTCRVIKNAQSVKYGASMAEVQKSVVQRGPVTAMLKDRLSPEMLARATALAIQYRSF